MFSVVDFVDLRKNRIILNNSSDTLLIILNQKEMILTGPLDRTVWN